MNIELFIEKCRKNATLPKYACIGDAGLDLYACETAIIKPGQTIFVPVGIKIAIPYGYEIQIRPRSGISFRTPIRIPNAPSTIDCGYKGEISVMLYNASIREDALEEPFTLDSQGMKHGTYKILEGNRIAQMVLAKVEYADLKVVDSVAGIGQDRGGGLGHTGI